MAEFYEMPAVSPTMEVGTLVAWKIAEGERFESGAVVAEVGTDKANMDAEIFDEGVMIKHLVAEGDEIPPGFPIAIWGSSADEDITELLAAFEARKASASEPAAAANPTEATEPATTGPSAAPPSPKAPSTSVSVPTMDLAQALERRWMGRTLGKAFQDPPGDRGLMPPEPRVKASPLARKIAAAKGIDLRTLRGSGPGGRIVKADVEQARPTPSAGAPVRADEAVRNSPMRKTIARRLLASHQEIPVFYLTATFDMGGFVALRQQLKRELPDRRISYNDILIKAVARALTEHPYVNARWGEDAITLRGSIDIGVAVALPAGLITPVVRNADQKSLGALADEVRALVERARDGKLAPEEYTGSSFTISNLGMMGIEQFTAIINPPEVAILAVGAIEEVPVIRDGSLAAGWRMKVTMSCDHRVIDGAVGAAFLQTLRRYVENPMLLLV